MKKFDCRDHHSRLARHQREVLKMDKSQFPEDGMLCPICSHVCRTAEDQRFVDSCLLFLFFSDCLNRCVLIPYKRTKY